MLKGKELLKRMKELGNKSQEEIIKGCGYLAKDNNGKENLLFNEFFESVLIAKGVIEEKTIQQKLEDNYPFKTEIERKTDLFFSIKQASSVLNYKIGSEILLDLIDDYRDETLENLARISGYKRKDKEGKIVIDIRDFLESVFKINSYRAGIPQYHVCDDKLLNGTSLRSLRLNLLAKLSDEEVNSPLLQELSLCKTSEIKLWLATKLAQEHSKVFKILETDENGSVSEATIFRELPSEWKNLTGDEKTKKIFREDVPLKILEILVKSPSEIYQEFISSSPSISKSSLEALNIKHQNKSSRYESLIKAAKRESFLPIEWRVLTDNERVVKLQNEVVDENILEILSYSESTEVNIAVILNSNVPLNILKRMRKEDANGSIQIAINRVLHGLNKYTKRKLSKEEKSELKKVEKAL